jgi:hypothetical protein
MECKCEASLWTKPCHDVQARHVINEAHDHGHGGDSLPLSRAVIECNTPIIIESTPHLLSQMWQHVMNRLQVHHREVDNLRLAAKRKVFTANHLKHALRIADAPHDNSDVMFADPSPVLHAS